MTLTNFIKEAYRLVITYGPTVVAKVINFARRNWRRVLEIVLRYGSVRRAFPTIRIMAGA